MKFRKIPATVVAALFLGTGERRRYGDVKAKGPRRLGGAFAIGLAMIVLTGTAVSAHPDGMQHGGSEGHLPPVNRGINLIGWLDLFATGEEQPGRIADVAGFGNYAYLGTFAEPDCDDLGVYVVDIANPAAPQAVDFIPTSDPTSFVGEGLQVLDMNTEHFQGQLLVYSQESCPPKAGQEFNESLGDSRLGFGGPGGATLVDVTNPEEWVRLKDHVGDNDPPPAGGIPFGTPHNSHSVFAWQQGQKAYMVVMDNGETARTDIDFFDITDPSNPVFLFETGLTDWPQAQESPPANGSTMNIHDFVVKQVGNRWLFLGSYWDAGYVVLDVTNIGNGSLADEDRAKYLRDTNFGAEEPLRSEMTPVLPAGMVPEGNAHQAEFSRDGSLFLASDEDFNPFRFTGVIDGGLYEDHTFTGTEGNATPPIDPEEGLSGPTKYVGQACDPATVPVAPTADTIALIERGPGQPCGFTVKIANAEAKGYAASVVFNDAVTDAPTGNCEGQILMLAAGNKPSLFVGRSTALKLMNVENITANTCQTATPPIGTASEAFSMKGIFDGWGYMHLYDANTMQAIDHWALPESLQEDKANGFGDLTIHEVATDPDANNIAYVSHYAGGYRVFQFDRTNGISEIGAFIDEGGNNLWGVEVLQHPTAGKIVLASDRDAGLYIFGAAPADLSPVGIRHSAAPTRNKRTELRATVANFGGSDAANTRVRFLDNGKQIGRDKIISAVPAGERKTATVFWTPTTAGSHTITVKVDPLNAIAELDEANNTLTRVLFVRRR